MAFRVPGPRAAYGKRRLRTGGRAALLALAVAFSLPGVAQGNTRGERRDRAMLQPLIRVGEPYKTPRAGQGFLATVFGQPLEIWPDDRRNVGAWNLGASWNPGLSDYELLPFGALYFWRHPSEDELFSATIVGAINEVFYSRSPEGWGPFEGVLTLESFTPPIDWAEFVDGERVEEEELLLGSVHLGMGVGYRRTVGAAQDNLLLANLLLEPGLLYFAEGADTASDFVVPRDTLETRLRLKLRWDALERNLFELAHHGQAAGLDAVWARRNRWEDWGRGAEENGASTREWASVTAYYRRAGGLPGLDDDRHRLVASAYGGIGHDVDRFSSPRLGGGPPGEDFFGVARPVLPAATVREFATERYAMLSAEYRYEPSFLFYLGPTASVTWLDRERLRGSGVERQDDVLVSLGFRVTSGFLGSSRLQLEYNYNAGLLRDDEFGGHAVLLTLAACF